MVSSTELLHEPDSSFSSRKGLKVLDFESEDQDAHVCLGNHIDITSYMQPSAEGCSSQRFVDLSHVSSSCCNFDEKCISSSAMEMSCQSNVNGSDVPPSSSTSTGASSYQEKSYPVYVSPAFVSGWIYVNEQGQMCGPYIQEQLYQGLSTGFLPDKLHVYPVVNGALINPVPLKYFKQFPDHVATGFAYLSEGMSSTTTPTNCSTSYPTVYSEIQSVSQLPVNGNYSSNQPILNFDAVNVTQYRLASGNESCWLYEDDEGRKHGPHSLSELLSWHCYGYLRDSLMIYHIENKYKPIALLSIINASNARGPETVSTCAAESNETGSLLCFVSEISEGVSSQLHSGIMKAARRVVLDEIIGNIIGEFLTTKKAQRRLKHESVTHGAQSCSVNGTRSEIAGERTDCAASACESAASTTIAEQTCISRISAQPPISTKSVGSIGNFWRSYAVVCGMLFDYCMQVMWNAVFYDTVAEYTSAWRKRKVWSANPNAKIPAGELRDRVQMPRRLPDKHLLSRQHSACDVDCPPGFELMTMVTDAHVLSSSIMPSLAPVRKDSSPEKTPPSSDDMYVDMTSILACVVDELHISAKVSLADYLDSFVEEELRKSFNSGEDDRLNELPHTSEYGSSDTCDELRTCSDDASDNYPSQGAKCISLSLSENHMSNSLATLFKDLCTHDDIGNLREINEPPPPGLEDCPKHLVSLPTCKFRPSRSDDGSPKIGEFVARAICRQKLHDDVLREWKSLFVDASLQQFLIAWRASKKPSEPDANEEGAFNGNKYTYYRKKKLPRKKLGSASHCQTPLNTGVKTQSVEKSRKHSAGDGSGSEVVEVQTSTTGLKKLGPSKGQIESSVNARPSRVTVKKSLPGDRSTSKMENAQKGSKVARKIQNNKVSKETVVKPSRDRASASSKNRNDLERVVDSNRHDGAVRQEFSDILYT